MSTWLELQAEINDLRAENQILQAEVDLYRSGCDHRDAELDKLKQQDRRIRRLLCVAVADRPYMDDGEASDQDIDYLRSTAEFIESAMQERNRKKLSAGAQPTRELTNLDIDILSEDMGMTGVPLKIIDLRRFACAVLEVQKGLT